MIISNEQIKNEMAFFCANIRYLRKKHKFTQLQMARKLHIGVASLRRLERGEIPPKMTIEVLEYIEAAFGVRANQMFEENGAALEKGVGK